MFSRTILAVWFLQMVFAKTGFAADNRKQSEQDAKWSWGNYEDPKESKLSLNRENPPSMAAPTTKTALAPPNKENDPCAPFNPEMPDFKKDGRTLSQVKCYEYIWDLVRRDKKKSREAQCRKIKGLLPIVPLVIGGRSTNLGEYPHMGAIGWKARVGAWVFLCGGSLISEKFVLTAAHCRSVQPGSDTVAEETPKIVRLGDKSILGTTSIRPNDAKILRIFVHPEYRSPEKYNDIALIELEKPIGEFTSFVQPACLWSQGNIKKLGNQAAVTGWGVVKTGSQTTSTELQSAVVDILDEGKCNKLLRRSCNRNWCGMRNQVCGGKLEGGVDSCQGDSGGPLQVKINIPPEVNGTIHFIVGVTSFGIGCARANSPGIYTNVSSYAPWVESIVW